MESIKITLLGKSGVGKTSLIIRHIQGVFVDEYDPTYDDSYRKQVFINDEAVMVDIVDIFDSSYEYIEFVNNVIRHSDGMLLVYSVVDAQSFKDLVEEHYERILRVFDVDACPGKIAVVGNKIDIEANNREVSREDVEQKCKEWGNVPHLEVSAKTTQSLVDEAFLTLYKRILEERRKEKGFLELQHLHKKKTGMCNVM